MFDAYVETLPPTVAIWQSLMNVYILIGTVAAVLVIGFLLYNIIRFSKKGNPAAYEHHEEGEWGNWKLTLLLVAISAAAIGYAQFQTFNSFSLIEMPAEGSIHIDVIAFQWGWKFVYPNGVEIVGNLTVPAGETIILNVTSTDVAHSFSLPELALGKDAIPGVYNTLWFKVPESMVGQQSYVGTVYCKELCGVGHVFMKAKLTVVSPSAYDAWYSSLGVK